MANGKVRKPPSSMARDRHWYDLFSRGARDWLRHNEKVREAVRDQLPDLVAGSDILSRPSDRTVQVPVRFLEHYRFRLRDDQEQSGVGQGAGQPGDVYRAGRSDTQGEAGQGGSGDGEYRFVFELKVDDIVDWLWEELALPDLEPRIADTLTDEDWVREGWDRRGPRSRLDRRRTVKEAIKRRAVQEKGPSFSNEDLRFRQLARRRRPATEAVVFIILDVSASMGEQRRKLAKSFFFWAMQGLRRQYGTITTVFIAHTNEAWEFSEEEFFQITATGGTVASTAFEKALEIIDTRFDPGRYNLYLFYASDGDNFVDDHTMAARHLTRLAGLMNFMGFVETPQSPLKSAQSEMGQLFHALQARGHSLDSYSVHKDTDIWNAIRAFFQRQAGTTEGEST